MMDGEWCQPPSVLTGDTLHVEMVIGVYTPEKPVYQMEGFDEEVIRQKWAEGYYVIVDGDDMIFYDEEEQRLCLGQPGPLLDYEEQGLTRSEMTVRFDLDLKAARAFIQRPELPEPITKDGATLAVQSIAVSPLQTHIVATFAPENASHEELLKWSDRLGFRLYDLSGNALNGWDLAANLEGGAYAREADDGAWRFEWEMTYIAPTPAMPAKAILAFETESGFRIELPVTFK